jgi:glycerol transport system ATP-binding protein
MAKIELRNLAHSYRSNPRGPEDYALHAMTQVWEDGAAYALLGPSGCGKTTLLNIMSGLVAPREGRLLFDDRDVTELPTERRNIAQVFQFPVIYDTMTVYDNLAFPLRNRGLSETDAKRRVVRVAELLDLTAHLHQRANHLTADAKQLISLGRGLVRQDVAAILFDEPLTVIDPHLKWRLRQILREVHREFRLTMVYVTHDQLEALTFADKVAVMYEGRIVQLGTPQDLFERPEHTFVGYFIGSPGMNLLPCEPGGDGQALIDGIPVPYRLPRGDRDARFRLGIRPEFVELVPPGTTGSIPAQVLGIEHHGTHRMVAARLGAHTVRARLSNDAPPPAERTALRFPPEWTCLYRNEHLVRGRAHG